MTMVGPGFVVVESGPKNVIKDYTEGRSLERDAVI